VRVAHLAGELDTGTAPFRAEYLGEQTATRPAELVLDPSESRWWLPPGRH
jgi:anti-anti-sigma regulatory factor